MFEKFTKKENSGNVEKASFLSKFDILSRMPSFSEHMKQKQQVKSAESIQAENQTTSTTPEKLSEQNKLAPWHDLELQHVYDAANLAEDPDNIYQLLAALQEQNIESAAPALASGQSSYFNQQIDESGFEKPLRLQNQDIEDAKFVAQCFGKMINYDNRDLPILYTTLPGTVEFNYAAQTFPAGIYEDVLQESPDHSLSTPPLVGEPENIYWQRVLTEKLSAQNLPETQIKEALVRGSRLINHFCQGKNRIYFIPINDLKLNHASFGDVDGLRDGKNSDTATQEVLQTLPTLSEQMEQSNIYDARGAYQDPNFSSEYGVAVYGPIQSEEIKYIEVERAYDIMQKRARSKGLQFGEQIR